MGLSGEILVARLGFIKSAWDRPPSMSNPSEAASMAATSIFIIIIINATEGTLRLTAGRKRIGECARRNLPGEPQPRFSRMHQEGNGSSAAIEDEHVCFAQIGTSH